MSSLFLGSSCASPWNTLLVVACSVAQFGMHCASAGGVSKHVLFFLHA